MLVSFITKRYSVNRRNMSARNAELAVIDVPLSCQNCDSRIRSFVLSSSVASLSLLLLAGRSAAFETCAHSTDNDRTSCFSVSFFSFSRKIVRVPRGSQRLAQRIAVTSFDANLACIYLPRRFKIVFEIGAEAGYRADVGDVTFILADLSPSAISHVEIGHYRFHR